MIKNMKFQSRDYFRQGEAFYMNRFEEYTKENYTYHSHDFVEICYVCSGNGYHIVDGREYKVIKGDLFIINCDVSHTFYKTSPNESLITFNIVFKPCFFDGILINFNDFNSLTLSYLFKDVFRDDNHLKEDLRLAVTEQKDMDLLMENMYKEYYLELDGYMNIIRAYMVELVVKIMRYFKTRSVSDESVSRNPIVITLIIDYLNENYSRKVSLNEIALNSFLSKNYLCKFFKKATGTTLHEYIQQIRVNEACTLLDTSSKTVVDIALEVGFSDYKSFNSVFKRQRGMTPKEYRKLSTHQK
jgi:AraC-type DNA-binding domain-containing proteins